MLHHGASRIFIFGDRKMKTYKSQLVGAAGTFALLAGMLSAAVAAPKAPAPKMATPKMAAKTTSHKTTAHKTAAHKAATHKTAAKSSQVTGTVTSIKGDSLTIKPTLKKMGASKTITVPASAKVWIGSKSATHKTVAHKAATHKTSTAKPAAHKAHA